MGLGFRASKGQKNRGGQLQLWALPIAIEEETIDGGEEGCKLRLKI